MSERKYIETAKAVLGEPIGTLHTPKRLTRSVDRSETSVLGRGLDEGTVNTVLYTVGEKHPRTFSFAEKIFDSSCDTAEERKRLVETVLYNHARLRAMDFPVIPVMRQIRGDDGMSSILMTDLSEGGGG